MSQAASETEPLEGWSRYAIYAVPPAGGALDALGREWLLGPDRPSFAGLGLAPEQIDSLVETPARYGFHGTLKPPMRLAEGKTAAELDAALAAYASARAPVEAPRLEMRADHGFAGLRCSAPAPALSDRAFEIVQEFDAFRAPMNADERARRKPETLDDRGRALLDAWGYPWIAERFNFHFTLSSWRGEEAETLAAQLAPIFDAALTDPFRLEDVALFGIRREGRPFAVLRRHRFSAY